MNERTSANSQNQGCNLINFVLVCKVRKNVQSTVNEDDEEQWGLNSIKSIRFPLYLTILGLIKIVLRFLIKSFKIFVNILITELYYPSISCLYLLLYNLLSCVYGFISNSTSNPRRI